MTKTEPAAVIITAVREGDRIFEEGVEILRRSLCWPRFEGADHRINRFYENYAARCRSFTAGELEARARAEYLASDDPKKRFSFPKYTYTLTFAEIRREGSTAAIRLECRLSRRGKAVGISRSTQTWDVTNAVLVRGVRKRRGKSDKKTKNIFNK